MTSLEKAKEIIKTTVEVAVKNNNIKSVEITGWEECGEYSGDDSRPKIKVEFFN